MKVICVPLLIIGFATLISCNNASSKSTQNETKSQIDSEKDQEAIFDVIEKEASSFYARDCNAWKNTRSQTDYEFQGWNNGDGTFDAEVGWAEVNNEIEKYIKEHREAITSHPKVIRKNIKCKFYGSTCAYLTWDQYNSDKAQKNYTHSKDMRIMEKQNGEWKIVTVASSWDYKNMIPLECLQ